MTTAIISLWAITNVFTVSSIVGTLMRLYLNELNGYNDHIEIYTLFPQVIGCFLIGLAFPFKDKIIGKRTYLLYTGISTGLCGSITTFSSWMLSAFRIMVSSIVVPMGESPSEQVGLGFANIVIVSFSSMASFLIGRFFVEQVISGKVCSSCDRYGRSLFLACKKPRDKKKKRVVDFLDPRASTTSLQPQTLTRARNATAINMTTTSAGADTSSASGEQIVEDKTTEESTVAEQSETATTHREPHGFSQVGGSEREKKFEALIESWSCVGNLELIWILITNLVLSIVLVVIIFIFSESNSFERGLSFVFAPFGTLSRYYLSKYNRKWPLGTFITNILATLIASSLFTLASHFFPDGNSQYSLSVNNGNNEDGDKNNWFAFMLIRSLIDGYCGCMSTVSTWIMELNVLLFSEKKNYKIALVYGCSSILLGLFSVFLCFGIWYIKS